jgi:hypothetical protein
MNTSTTLCKTSNTDEKLICIDCGIKYILQKGLQPTIRGTYVKRKCSICSENKEVTLMSNYV